MADLPIFIQTPNTGIAQLNEGVESYVVDGSIINNNPTKYKKIFTSGPNGSILTNFIIESTTLQEEVVRLMIKDPNSNEVAYVHIVNVPPPLVGEGQQHVEIKLNFKMQANMELYVSKSKTTPGREVFFTLIGGNF